MALFSALVAATGRPLRLLLQEGVPSFVSNIGRIAGALPVHVPPEEVASVLHEVLVTEGVGPDHAWGVAIHRAGQVSSPEWLSECGSRGLPTIELCLGSLGALAGRGPSPATFTIVDLNAEGAFEGVQLTALLTDDSAMAERVRALCLPGPEDRDYVLDAAPRGLDHDEPLLARVVERAISQFETGGARMGGEGSLAAIDRSPFGLAWNRRFGLSAQAALSSAPESESLWRAGQAEVAGPASSTPASLQHRLDQLKIIAEDWQTSQAEEIAAARSESRRRIDELQAALEQSESRASALEAEASIEASRVRALLALQQERTDALEVSIAAAEAREADLQAQKVEIEGALLAVRDEGETLVRTLARTERERDLAVLDAANREESERRSLAEHRLRVEELEKTIAAAAEREASLAATSEAARADLSARIVRLEADAVVFGKARADLLSQKAELEATLLAVRGEGEALAGKLARLEKERDLIAVEAVKREESDRLRLAEHRLQVEELEKAIAASAEREASLAATSEAARADLSARIVRLEADAVVGGKARTDLLAQKAELEATLLEVRGESETLGKTLTQVEGEREAAAREVADLQVQKTELEGTLLDVRREGGTLASKLAEAEGAREAAAREVADLRTRQSELEGTLLTVREESETLGKKLARVERERDLAVRDAANREESERRGVAAHRLQVEQLEDAIAASTEHEASQAREWDAARADLSERIARLAADAVLAEKAQAAFLAEQAAARAAIAALETEGETRLEKLGEVERDRDQAMAEAARRDLALRSHLGEERQRADQLGKEIAELKSGEARLTAELEARSVSLGEALERAARLDTGLRASVEREAKQSREREISEADMSERIKHLEAARLAAESAHREVAALKDQGDRALSSLQAQSEGLVRKLTEAENARAAVLAKAARQEEVHQEVNRADRDGLKRRVEELQNERNDLADRIARIEKAAVVAENVRADLLGQKVESERTLAATRAELEALARKLSEAESDRDRARAKIAKSEEALRAAFEEEKLQAEQKLQTALQDREAQLSGEWTVSRSEMSNRIARLEAAAAMAESERLDLLGRKAESEQALLAVRAEAEALTGKLAEAERDRDRARADVARNEEVVLAAFEEQRQRAAQFEKHEAELKDQLSGDWVVSRAGLSDRINSLEAAVAEAEKARADLLAEKAQVAQDLAAAVQDRDQFRAAAERVAALPGTTSSADGASAIQLAASAESSARLAVMEAERQALVARLAEAEERRDQALAESARREETRKAQAEVQRQRAAELDSRIAAAIEREAKQTERWRAAQAELSARIARLEANEAMADRARTELLNRKKESERALAALQNQKDALAKRLDAVESARDQARATVARYEAAHEELLASGAPLERWRARFKPALPEAEGRNPRNTGPLSTLVKGWATAATQGPNRRNLPITDPVAGGQGGDGDIDHTAVLDEIAASSAPPAPDTPAPVDAALAEGKGEAPPQIVRPSSIERLHPSPPAPRVKVAPKKEDEADRSGRWLSGLANRIRRGPKDPS